MSDQLPIWLIELCRSINLSGGKAFLVGGCVRDRLLGYPVKDYDIEVYGLPSEQLRALLERYGKVSTVGEHFAVYKLKPNADPAYEIDISLPRRESKYGSGHRGFIIQGDPWMTFQEAANRRDFTINSILQDPLSGEIIDPCHGLHDLNNRELRVVNKNTFRDDSLRVLRAAQLSSRYSLKINSNTKILCQTTNLEDIPKERIWNEIRKLLLLSPRPSLGFRYLLELGIIEKLFPMFWELHSSPIGENPYSAEFAESAWDYVLSSLDRAKVYVEEVNDPEKILIFISVVSIRLSFNNMIQFLNTLGLYKYQGYNLRDQVIKLNMLHLIPYKTFLQDLKQEHSIFVLQRISRAIDLKLVTLLLKALHLGDSKQFLTWLEEKLLLANRLEVPLLKGRHIVDMGLTPGPDIGKVLRQIYEYQIERKITNLEDGKRLARNLFSKKEISYLENFQESE
ncbi:MAG: CCA tRNA nucleotidyltransferase [Acidobacteriota bacterium]